MQKPNSILCFEAYKTEIVLLDRRICLGLSQLLKLIKYAHDL